VDILLQQSKTLADILKFAFNTQSGIPHNEIYINNDTSVDDGFQTGLATAGTLVMEWTRLSDLLNDTTYANLSQKAEEYLLNPQPKQSEPFPGLVGGSINITSGLFTSTSGGWVGGDDSFYEYLIKMYIYDPTRFSSYKDRWVLAVDSTIQNLTSHPSSRPEATFVAEFAGTRTIDSSGHLACFDGGNFILGGLVLGRQDYIDYGLKVVDGCHLTYNSTVTKIGPENYGWNASQIPDGQDDFYNQNGFYITTSYYDLRPEVIESYYYAYRATGDTKYQDWAWDAFVAINSTCRTDSGFTAVGDVNVEGGGDKFDNQESFWFAEVMKYSYLIHAAVSFSSLVFLFIESYPQD
jgi:mannosyl-oligosaccharide alpha-1,2-mannosidase